MPKTAEIIPALEFLKIGLDYAGFENRYHGQTAVDRFRSTFGVSHETCSTIFADLQPVIKNPRPIYLLMTLNWLRFYDTEVVLAGNFKRSEKVVRQHLKEYLKSIQLLAIQKIVWPYNDANILNAINHDSQIFLATVDGVHCRVREPRKHPSPKWCSHKFHGPGVAYEVAVDICHSKVVWINGPFPAGTPDLAIFREPGGLKSKIPVGKRLIADRGYRGEQQNQLSIRNSWDTPEVKKFKNRALSRHESFNSRIKCFAILAERFRHDITLHKSAFEAVCVLVQYDMDNEHPLFS